MNNSILIGNGLNRCLSNGVSWGDLLQSIADEYEVEHNPKISFPMEFENIANQILQKEQHYSKGDLIYTELKTEIINLIDSLDDNEFSLHSKFMTLPVKSVFTTNYDYLLEKNTDINFSKSLYYRRNIVGNNKYNLNQKIHVVNKDFYHIHGEMWYPQSICLGYEHYSGTLQYLRTALSSKTKGIPKIALALNNTTTVNVWAEKFFTDNIYIVGLGLSDSEIDLWWLLTYRAYLYYSNRASMHKYIKNRIVYYDVGIEENKNLKFTLTNQHVEYRFIKSENYRKAYENICDEIKDEISKQY